MTTTNNTSSPSIQAIDKQSVHQICSGQVVLDLSTAVKELIENGLDASANNIEIKLREHGQQLIEVSDNGTGIEEKDFESIALKHYTSKIKEFHDLTFVDTFGFRGEALSSLSAVSDLCLSTKHKSADVGCKIDFDHNGKIISKNQIAKEQGTTVTVTNLFYTLPVRYKEFSRNYKKDFTKLINVLYSYSLINSNCRFKCTNFVNKNRNIILSTNGKSNILDIITSLFGPKQTKNLIAIVQDNINETVSEEYNLTQFKQIDNIFTLTGYISNVLHGCGRSTPDRQFLFINKRPCDFSKLSRVINEAYHQYNRHQYPFVMLDISLNKEFVDVNVTPDKRSIMIHQEKVLFALVKSSLKSMFEVLATQFEEGNNENQTVNVFSPLSKIGNCSENLSFNDSYETNIITRNNTPNLKLHTDSVPKDTASPLERFRSKYSAETKEKAVTKQPKIQDFLIKSPALKRRKIEISPNKDNVDLQIKTNLSDFKISNSQVSENLNSVKLKQNTSVDDKVITLVENSFSENLLSDKNTIEINDIDSTHEERSFYPENQQAEASSILSKSPLKILEDSVSYCEERVNIDISPENKKFLPNPNINNNNKKLYDHDSIIHKKVKVHFDFENVKKSFEKYHMKTNSENAMDTLAFYAKISPTDNKSAETELSKHVSKETFLKMKILGQFNLGFIIAKYNSELFIIDQHASDEKYNFETLQRKHCLKGQKLIKPLLLELTNVNESVLIDNIDIFKKNGFDFEISEQKDNVERQNRIKLLTIPTSKNWSFSIDDVEELIFMLSDSPGTMCRPSRVRSMFASRACRKSVMVGTALNKRQMKELVTHMSEIEHPWNCPHGRPTMRHLINLKRLSSN